MIGLANFSRCGQHARLSGITPQQLRERMALATDVRHLN